MAKMSQQEWAFQIERGLKRHELQQRREREQRFEHLWHYLPIPIILGLVACVLDVLFYGWRQFFHDLISWTIGITVVTTAMALFSRRGKR